MKKIIIAMFSLTSAFVSQAETISYNASSCNVKYGNAEKVFQTGSIENRSGNYDVLYCDIPLTSNRTVEKLSANVYVDSTKANSESRCNFTLHKGDSVAVVANGRTDRAENGSNVLTYDLNSTLIAPTRGTATCTVGAVEDGGLVRFTSLSVTYSD